jgi:hypothetical protein
MKKIIIPALCLASISLYADNISDKELKENVFYLTKNKTFISKVDTNKMTMSFRLNSKGTVQKEAFLEQEFSKAINAAKATKLCKGGRYSINPNYSWNNGKRYFEGFNGNVSFKCSFSNEKEEQRINRLKERFSNLRYVKLSQGVIQNKLEVEKIEETKELLEKESITYGLNYAHNLSIKTDMKCSINNISFDNASFNRPVPMYSRAMDVVSEGLNLNSSIAKPIKEPESVKLTTNFKFKCKK